MELLQLRTQRKRAYDKSPRRYRPVTVPQGMEEWFAPSVAITAEWQAAHDPDSDEEPAEDLRFRYDGKFIANPQLVGKWHTVGTVSDIGDFDPKGKNPLLRPSFKEINFAADGSTWSPSDLWSGKVLIDLDRSQALEVTPKAIDGTDYLIIEAGGFSPKNPVGWKTPLMVLKRK